MIRFLSTLGVFVEFEPQVRLDTRSIEYWRRVMRVKRPKVRRKRNRRIYAEG